MHVNSIFKFVELRDGTYDDNRSPGMPVLSAVMEKKIQEMKVKKRASEVYQFTHYFDGKEVSIHNFPDRERSIRRHNSFQLLNIYTVMLSVT